MTGREPVWRARSDPRGAVFTVRVQPGAGRTAVAGTWQDALKIQVTASPDRGEANRACLAFLARRLGVATSRLELASGARNRTKLVRVRGLDPEQVQNRLQPQACPEEDA